MESLVSGALSMPLWRTKIGVRMEVEVYVGYLQGSAM